MTTDLQDLYQEVILDHNKRPRNFGRLDAATHQAEGYNPLCGDRVTVYLEVDGDRVAAIRFDGSGCAISTASASVMTEMVKGKSRAEVEAIFHRFHDLLTTESGEAAAAELGKLAVFAGVKEFPIRVKCATLVWHTLLAAMKGEKETISTE